MDTPVFYKTTIFACGFVWVWNLVCDIERGTYMHTEDVWEQGAGENIWTEGGWKNGRLEKTT
jgi:hypothetical protein